MTGSHRHTCLWTLDFSDATPTDPTPIAQLNRRNKIFLQEGPFQVLDGNAVDGALFQLPAPGCDTVTVATVAGCDYAVYVRALGGPRAILLRTSRPARAGTSITTATVEFQCSTESVHVERNKGKSTFQNVTRQLLTLCLDTDADNPGSSVTLACSCSTTTSTVPLGLRQPWVFGWPRSGSTRRRTLSNCFLTGIGEPLLRASVSDFSGTDRMMMSAIPLFLRGFMLPLILTSAALAQTSSVSVRQRHVDFGTVVRGAVLEHTFTLVNELGRPCESRGCA